ncbi:DUF6944 family repetitive protein [Psychrobacillus sp. NPDC096426]|uniref:DUF6944 family repetitive protein n=1 Tax=Psychrobacillus sp. NPDC096426 TaxID=3364491 RepID=UPI003828C8F7
MKQHGEELVYTAAWIVTIGTVITAIGQTSKTFTESLMGANLIAKGNAIEAFGNSLEAIGTTVLLSEEKESYLTDIIFGAWIQAVGNVTNTVTTNIEIATADEGAIGLNAVGSGIQGLGATYEAIGALEGHSPFKSLEVTGLSILALGAFLDAVGLLFSMKNLNRAGDRLSFIGSWTQVIGAFTVVIALKTASDINLVQQQEQDYYCYQYYNYPIMHLYDPNFNRMI